MLWYQLSATYLVQLQHAQMLQPVALLVFRVEVIQMFLPIVPIQICQAKLVLCFTGQSSMSTHWMCTEIRENPHNWALYCLTALVNTFLWISSACWNKWLIFLFSLLCLDYLKFARIVDVYCVKSVPFMSVVHTYVTYAIQMNVFSLIYEKHIKYIYFRF